MISDNKRLYDLSTRIALYIEGVKVQQTREFNTVLFELSEVFKKLLGRVQYSTLDGLSKAKLNKLVLELRKSQSEIYSRYTEKLLKQLEEFTAVALEVNRRVYASDAFLGLQNEDEISSLNDESALNFIIEENEENGFVALFGLPALISYKSQSAKTLQATNNKVFTAGLNTPLAANGFYPIPFIKTFSNSAQAQTENIIRKGWANQATPAETILELVGNPNQPVGLGSQIKRIRNQAAAVINTTMGHFSNIASAAVQSALFGRYMWVSIIDGSTTDICISRNGKIYYYGSGPIPPAHIGCRSHITPFSISNAKIDETYYTWISRQPAKIQNDFLGKKIADSLRVGELKAKDLSKHTASLPLTLKEFLGKVESILT